MDLTPDARVNWNHTPRGGYGFAQPVAAVVRKRGPKRVQIEVRRLQPYSKPPLWLPELKWVPPESLSERLFPCAVFGEPMLMEVQGFRLTGWKHPNGYSTLFRNGTWYGAVNDYTCTAPHADEEGAVREAYLSLTQGHYMVALLSAIEVRQHWIASGQKTAAECEAELQDLRERLAKYEAAFPEVAQGRAWLKNEPAQESQPQPVPIAEEHQ